MKVCKVMEKEISKCYHECPYFDNDCECMVCTHKDAMNRGLIISHPDCDNGFPELCPLLRIAK